MRAMILAAGRGMRMRPLTNGRPKVLLEVGGKSLIVWQIERLVAAGFREIVINHSHLGQMIERQLIDGRQFNARITYSPEAEPLEALGGIVQALRMLGDQPFVLVSGDIYTTYPYQQLQAIGSAIASDYPRRSAHLVLTDNPAYHPQGDMGLKDGSITVDGPHLTYANIGVFHPRLFSGLSRGEPLKLFPWIYRFLGGQRVTGEHYSGVWHNVGTADELGMLNERLHRQATSRASPVPPR
jgi:MurNAc alpha-1-phosphate uridylyltransferase